MKKIVLMLAAMALMAGTAQAAWGDELVTNGDFESGTYVVDTIPDGWEWNASTYVSTSVTTGGLTVTNTWVPGDSGSLVQWKAPPGAATTRHVVQIQGPNYSSPATLGGVIQKDIPVIKGIHYLFSFDARSMATTSWFSVQVRWRDAEGGSLGHDNDWVGSYFWLNSPTNTSANAWFVPSYSAEGYTANSEWWSYPDRELISPNGAVTADIHFMAWWGCAHQFDNVSLIEIPEPLTLSLLGLGGLMLRRRKK